MATSDARRGQHLALVASGPIPVIAGQRYHVRRRLLVAVAPVLTPVLLLGCARHEPKSSNAATQTKVIYLTGLGIYGQEAFIWVALAKGFFEEAGLAVQIQPGQGAAANLRMLGQGKVDFAAVDSSGAQVEYAAGPGRDWRLVAAIHQQTAICVSAVAGSGIQRPQDLEGRTIGYVAGGMNHALFGGYAARAGIDASTIRWVRVEGQQLPAALASGRVDAVTSYVTSSAAMEAAAGQPVVNFEYRQVLPSLYGNALAASTQTIAKRPQLVRAFAAAVIRGLRYAIDNPDEAGRIFAKYQPGYPAQTAAAETRIVRAHAIGHDGEVGTFDPARMRQAMDTLHGLGFNLANAAPEDLVAFDMVPAK
jgi:NitT/TauT family transport system substrate-binding protein